MAKNKSWQYKALEARLLTTVEDEQARAYRERKADEEAALRAQLAAAQARSRQILLGGCGKPERKVKMTTDIDIAQIRQRGQIEQAAETAAELDAMRQRIAELEQHILMLTKLPTWKPAEDGFTHLCGCIDCTGEDPDAWGWQLYVNHNGIGIEDPDDAADSRWVLLPDDLRLCRFTPAP